MSEINALNDVELMDAIEKAIDAGEFKPFYQPQYDSVTGKLVSAEALARWIKPDGSVVSPGVFIPCAEQSELITKLDWSILEQVCQFQKRRRDEKHRCVPVAVNFSRKHFAEPDFRQRLIQVVDRYDLPHDLIEVELTESAIMHDPEAIVNLIAEIRNDGFSVAIDDFGSGLSSLSLVKDISANVLKIDRSLLSGNCENEKERIVLESIFAFAHRLKLTTIAEGVETREQLGFLRTCDCRLIQGFLFAKPMPEDDFAAACSQRFCDEYNEDILLTQPHASVTSILMEVMFAKFPLVIMSNLTRNSFYMMAYDNYSSTSCPSTGIYSELIAHAATTIHPDDRHIFEEAFSMENHYAAYDRGEKYIKAYLRQMGDDGNYHRVEMTDYFVKNPSVDDILVVTVSQILDDCFNADWK